MTYVFTTYEKEHRIFLFKKICKKCFIIINNKRLYCIKYELKCKIESVFFANQSHFISSSKHDINMKIYSIFIHIVSALLVKSLLVQQLNRSRHTAPANGREFHNIPRIILRLSKWWKVGVIYNYVLLCIYPIRKQKDSYNEYRMGMSNIDYKTFVLKNYYKNVWMYCYRLLHGPVPLTLVSVFVI